MRMEMKWRVNRARSRFYDVGNFSFFTIAFVSIKLNSISSLGIFFSCVQFLFVSHGKFENRKNWKTHFPSYTQKKLLELNRTAVTKIIIIENLSKISDLYCWLLSFYRIWSWRNEEWGTRNEGHRDIWEKFFFFHSATWKLKTHYSEFSQADTFIIPHICRKVKKVWIRKWKVSIIMMTTE